MSEKYLDATSWHAWITCHVLFILEIQLLKSYCTYNVTRLKPIFCNNSDFTWTKIHYLTA